jgi:hypothetical protein
MQKKIEQINHDMIEMKSAAAATEFKLASEQKLTELPP